METFTCFDNLTTESDVVKYILVQNSELKETYQIYQDVLFAIKSKDKVKFDKIISNSYTNISTYMITSLNTLKEYKEYIHNTIDSNLTNGKMEGNNNLIKVIKRIAFGFRLFRRFKARIMIIVGLLKPNKKELRI